MPEHPAPHSQTESGADTTPGAQNAHGGGHHGVFNLNQSILHHVMPYPSWELFHLKPIIVFDRGTYAAMNLETFKASAAFEKADGSQYYQWAQKVVKTEDYHYDLSALKKSEGDDAAAKVLSNAMAVVEAPVVFPQGLSWVNNQLFFGFVSLSIFAFLLCVVFRRKTEQVKPVGRFQHMIEALTVYLRDEMVRPLIPHADAWTPFFVCLFTFILISNLFGLIPGLGTFTGNIGVTGALASVIFFCTIFFGFKAQGPKFLVNIVHIPFSVGMAPIWCLLWVLEIFGLFAKPAALAIRLFANMFAGHLAMLIFLALGWILLASNPTGNRLVAGAFEAAGVFTVILYYFMELLVAFIQAYVFTLLSAIFISMSVTVHSDHEHGHEAAH